MKLSYQSVLGFSALVFAYRLVKLWISMPSFFNMMVTMQENPTERAIFYAFLIVLVFGVAKAILNFAIGKMSESELSKCYVDIERIAVDLILVVVIGATERTKATGFLLVLTGIMCLRFFILCIRQRVMSFSLLATPPSLQRHQRLLFVQIMTILFVLHLEMLAISCTMAEEAKVVVMAQLFHGLLDIVWDLIRHVVFIGDREKLGNSQATFMTLMKVEFGVVIANLTVDILHFGWIIYLGHTWIPCLKSLAECLQSLRTTIGSYRSWSKVHEFVLHNLPAPEPSDLADGDLCIICRLAMDVDHAKKLPCGHCLHADCLERWIGEQRKCPLCQADLELYMKKVEEEQRRKELEEAKMQEREIRDRRKKVETYNFADLDRSIDE